MAEFRYSDPSELTACINALRRAYELGKQRNVPILVSVTCQHVYIVHDTQLSDDTKIDVLATLLCVAYPNGRLDWEWSSPNIELSELCEYLDKWHVEFEAFRASIKDRVKRPKSVEDESKCLDIICRFDRQRLSTLPSSALCCVAAILDEFESQPFKEGRTG